MVGTQPGIETRGSPRQKIKMISRSLDDHLPSSQVFLVSRSDITLTAVAPQHHILSNATSHPIFTPFRSPASTRERWQPPRSTACSQSRSWEHSVVIRTGSTASLPIPEEQRLLQAGVVTER